MLVRNARRPGSGQTWQIDLLVETSPADRPVPFTAQSHSFDSRSVALEWLGIREADDGPERS
jgi:hypothetical protein